MSTTRTTEMKPSKVREQVVVYHIDPMDRLCEVNSAWSEVALANDGAGAMPDRVMGGSLWDFIEDSHVQELYRQILHRVRAGHPAQFDYRCDAPEWRRLFRMTIRMAAGGTVEFSSRLAWEEQRQQVDLLDPKIPRIGDCVRVCSWCQKISMPDGSWVAMEKAVAQLGLMEKEALPKLTHGICPPCHSGMMRLLPPEIDHVNPAP